MSNSLLSSCLISLAQESEIQEAQRIASLVLVNDPDALAAMQSLLDDGWRSAKKDVIIVSQEGFVIGFAICFSSFYSVRISEVYVDPVMNDLCVLAEVWNEIIAETATWPGCQKVSFLCNDFEKVEMLTELGFTPAPIECRSTAALCLLTFTH